MAFDTDAHQREPVQTAGGMIGGADPNDALVAIGNHATNPAGLTAIGDGIERAATQLAAVAGVYDQSATVVFTDGHETAAKTISQVASSIGSRVYAVGLGTPDQLNPGALSTIANATGGYALLTGNPGPDDSILLQKYFAQVLAGVTNNAIVVDPDGFLQVGDEAVVPYQVTSADARNDVIVLAPAADAIEVALEAPDGSLLTPGNGAVEVIEETYRVLRAALPGPVDPRAVAGTWHARRIPTLTAGVYRLLVRARGVDLRGTSFTREELRTVSVWDRGDDPPPEIGPMTGGSAVDWCGLLHCWLSDDRVKEFLARQEIDVDGMVRCLKRSCR